MEWLDFAETWAVVIFTYLISTVLFIFVVWGYDGFPRFWTELGLFLVIVQLGGAGILIFVPLIGYYLSTFKIVRRE